MEHAAFWFLEAEDHYHAKEWREAEIANSMAQTILMLYAQGPTAASKFDEKFKQLARIG